MQTGAPRISEGRGMGGVRVCSPRETVPPQEPVDDTIVDVSALGVKLTYPDASLAVVPARDRQIEPEAVARTR